jgi:ABC-type uncharacterized transport system auxiliary subunit
VAALSLAVTSCQSYIRTDYFIIDTNPSIAAVGKQFPLRVVVNNVRSPSRYQDQMFYRSSGYEVGFYEYSRWVEPPAEMVRRALINALRSSNLFISVVSMGQDSSPNLTLQTTITSFDQVVTKDGNFAECELAMGLLTGGGKPIWLYDAKARVKQEHKGKFAAAMSQAVHDAIGNAIADMETSAAIKELAGQQRKPAGDGQRTTTTDYH